MNRSLIILTGLFLSSCQQNQPPGGGGTSTPAVRSGTPQAVSSGTPAHHEHKAPHGGALVELGEEAAHLEVLWDAKTGKMVVYCIDGECEKPLRSVQKELGLKVDGKTFLLPAVANPLTGESVGDSSQFESVLAELKGRPKWEGEFLEVTLQGQTYRNLDFDYPIEADHAHSH